MSEAWNNLEFIDYINLAYEWVNGNHLHIMKNYTIINLCYSHLRKNMFRTIKKHYSIKVDNKITGKLFFFLYHIMHEVKYDKVKMLWTHLNALCSERNASIAQNHQARLHEIINRKEKDINPFIEICDDEDESEDVDSDPWYSWIEVNDEALYKRSKFYKDFEQIKYIDKSDCTVDNIFYKPNFIKEILQVFMPYIPLFGKILIVDISSNDPIHFSNASTEGAFGELKMKMDQASRELGRRPIKVGRFVNFSRKRINDKILEYVNDFPRKNFTNKLSKTLHRTKNRIISKKQAKKNKLNKRAANIDPVEVWGRTKKTFQ